FKGPRGQGFKQDHILLRPLDPRTLGPFLLAFDLVHDAVPEHDLVHELIGAVLVGPLRPIDLNAGEVPFVVITGRNVLHPLPGGGRLPAQREHLLLAVARIDDAGAAHHRLRPCRTGEQQGESNNDFPIPHTTSSPRDYTVHRAACILVNRRARATRAGTRPLDVRAPPDDPVPPPETAG